MRRLHVIEDFNRMGGEIYYREDKYAHDPELLEAYKCGKKDGWREAMHESEGYGERRMYDDRGRVINYREHGRGGIDYREEYDDDMYDERRRRRANGRFY